MLTKTILCLFPATLFVGCSNLEQPYITFFGLFVIMFLSTVAMLVFVWIGSRKAIRQHNGKWPKGFTTNPRN